MARRTPSKATTEAQPAKAEATPEATQEEAVTTTVEENEVTEATAAEDTEAESTEEEEGEDVFAAFNQAVEEALAQKDSSTGTLPTASIAAVNEQYRALDGLKAKNRARKSLNEGMLDAMNQMDLPTARAYVQLSEGLSPASAGSKAAPRTPADPTEAFVSKAVTLRLAAALVKADVPEGVAEDWADKANALFDSEKSGALVYLEWVSTEADKRGDEPDVSSVVKSAVKLSQGKAARAAGPRRQSQSAGGERRDIAKHIYEAFADKKPGDFMKISEIKNFVSSEYGEDYRPSAGAISARLFPDSGKMTLEGVEPTKVDNDKGARKL